MIVFTAPEAFPPMDVPSAMTDPRSANAVAARSERSVIVLGNCMVGFILGLWNVKFCSWKVIRLKLVNSIL